MKIGKLSIIYIYLIGLAVSGDWESVDYKLKKYPLIKSRESVFAIPDKIIMSPLSGKTVWDLINLQELDPSTGEWKSLKDIVGDSSYPISKVIKDSINTNYIWFVNAYGELSLYNIELNKNTRFKRTEYFKYSSVKNVIPTDEIVWITTKGGLFGYERKGGEIFEIEKLKNIPLEKIIAKGNMLFLNNEYVYNLKTQQLKRITEEEIPERLMCKIGDYKIYEKPNKTIIKTLKDQILYTLDNLKGEIITIEDEKYAWIYDGSFIKLNLEDNEQLKRKDYSGSVSHIYNFGNYIYFITSYRLARLNKTTTEIEIHLLKSWTPSFTTDEENFWIWDEETILCLNKRHNNRYFEPIYNLDEIEYTSRILIGSFQNEENIIKKIKKADKALTFLWDNKDVIGKDKDHRIIMGLPTRDKKEVAEVIKFIETTEKSTEKEIAYFILATSPFLYGDADLSYKHYKLLKKEYPGSAFLEQDGWDKVELAYKELKKIDSLNLPEDEKLWRIGHLFLDAHKVEWNVIHPFYNRKYSTSLFEKIIRKYPNSEFADNAEFEFIWLTKAHLRDDDVVHLYGVEKNVELMKSFIEKYPESELLPEAKIRIAQEYFLFIKYNTPMELSEIKKYANIVIAYCKDIIENHSKSKEFDLALDLLKRVNTFLDDYLWKLELTLNDTLFSIGDTVTTTIKLINLRNYDKEIQLYSDIPNFEIQISPIKKIKFIEGIEDIELLTKKHKRDKKTIPANGGYFTETQKLQKLIRNSYSHRNQYGKFIITEEGKYEIFARYEDNIRPDYFLMLNSNKVSFTVKEK
jgi:hypothetical protein